MSVIIRLQNLPWSANALDIRQYFHGLGIPEGGVHIVGGELGDAFIAFSTDEDARQAFDRNNGKIKEIQVKLMLSSRTEMQKVIAAARAQTYAAFMQPSPSPTNILPAAVPVLPSAVPEIKRDDKSKRERRRSRSGSRSRDRNDRSKDRKDRRHRDRSRSRSRERRDRRRRDRSRSRSRDRNGRDDRKGRNQKQNGPKIWANPIETGPNQSQNGVQTIANHLGFYTRNLDDPNPMSNINPVLSSGSNFIGNNPLNVNSWNGNNQLPLKSDMGFNNQRGPMNQNKFQRNDDINQKLNFERPNLDDTELPSACVRLEPFYGGYGDVRRFFHGLFISNKGIKFINDDYGHRTGKVYIQFGHPQGKTEALRKNGSHLNNLEVHVTSLDEVEFQKAVDRFLPQGEDPNNDDGNPNFKFRNQNKFFKGKDDIKDFSCVTVEDLPTYVKEQDILHMFSAYPLFSLILTNKPRGGHIAYVKFSNQEGARNAFEEKQYHIIAGKPVTVRPCSDEDFELVHKAHDVDLEGSKVVDIGTDCVLVSKLPPKMNERDIEDFFSDVGVIPAKINLVTNSMGFTGKAYCEFETKELASKAVKKDNTLIGSISVSVKPVSRNEMLAELNGVGMPPMENLVMQPPMHQNRNINNMNNTNMNNFDSREPYNNHPDNMNMDRMNHMDMPPRHMMPLNDHFDHRGPPPPHFNQHRPPFFNRNFNGGGNGFMGPRGGPRFGPRGGGPRFRYNGPPQNYNQDPEYMDGEEQIPPGCTVYMNNVPYKAGTNEILEFFDGYNVRNNVSRRYNPNNTPSPEARVFFNTPDDAYRAVQEKNGEMIWDRQIFLKQA